MFAVDCRTVLPFAFITIALSFKACDSLPIATLSAEHNDAVPKATLPNPLDDEPLPIAIDDPADAELPKPIATES